MLGDRQRVNTISENTRGKKEWVMSLFTLYGIQFLNSKVHYKNTRGENSYVPTLQHDTAKIFLQHLTFLASEWSWAVGLWVK